MSTRSLRKLSPTFIKITWRGWKIVYVFTYVPMRSKMFYEQWTIFVHSSRIEGLNLTDISKVLKFHVTSVSIVRIVELDEENINLLFWRIEGKTLSLIIPLYLISKIILENFSSCFLSLSRNDYPAFQITLQRSDSRISIEHWNILNEVSKNK